VRRLFRAAAIGAVVALAAGAWWTQALGRAAEDRHPPEGRRVRAGGVDLCYVERGTGSPVVLVHGAFGGLEDWQVTVLDEIARSHRVLAFDRPGHGWSEPLGGTGGPLAQARTLRVALAELGVERPLLVGFSFGGALALAWASEWPDELGGVLLVSPVAYPWPGSTDVEYVAAGLPLLGPLLAHTLVAPLGEWTRSAAVARSFDPAPVAPEYDGSPLELALRPAQFLTVAREMRTLKRALAIQSPRYPRIRAPLEIVAGRGDVVTWWDFHSARLSREVPSAALTVVDGAGHQIPYSHPRELLEALERLAARADRR
jgi:pimeloyl-ACP methyl ester carboxylesterase